MEAGERPSFGELGAFLFQDIFSFTEEVTVKEGRRFFWVFSS